MQGQVGLNDHLNSDGLSIHRLFIFHIMDVAQITLQRPRTHLVTACQLRAACTSPSAHAC
jgi:hypothetical protein